MFWDLHKHSIVSDGLKSPDDILSLYQKIDPMWKWYWSITDHNKLPTEEFVTKARNRGVRYIIWTEISAYSESIEQSLHVTCYAPKIIPELAKCLMWILSGQKWRILSQLDHLRKMGFMIENEKFFEFIKSKWMTLESISNWHIAEYIWNNERDRKHAEDLTNGNIPAIAWEEQKILFMRECLWRNWDFKEIGYVEVPSYEPNLSELVRMAKKEDLLLSVAHPNFSFSKKLRNKFWANSEEQTIHYFESYIVPSLASEGMVNYEINSLASKAWTNVLLATRERLQGYITYGSDNHWLPVSDKKHGIVWEINPLIQSDDVRHTQSLLASYL